MQISNFFLLDYFVQAESSHNFLYNTFDAMKWLL